jgi:hypothetical protein
MPDDLKERMTATLNELHGRALELSKPNGDRDMATLMRAMALQSEALMTILREIDLRQLPSAD